MAVVAVLAVLVCAAFWDVRTCDFINLDDNVYVTENVHIRPGLTWEGFKWALTADLFEDAPNADYWQPVTFVSRMIDFHLFGMNPAGHHLTNLLIHLLNGLLLLHIFHRLTGAFWASACSAALFLLHPLRVESVAWVVERKDVLSALFGLMAIEAYRRHVLKPSIGRYGWVCAAFLLSLMSKPMMVTLPILLLVLDYWPLNRLAIRPLDVRVWMRVLLEKVPLLGLSAASAVITLLVGQPQAFRHPSYGEMLATPIVSYVRYLGLTVWPVDLAIYYPPADAFLNPVTVAASAALFLGITVVSIRLGIRRPWVLFAWLWFVVSLLPAVGLVNSTIADRFTYAPHMGLFVVLAWGVPDLISNKWRPRPTVLSAAAVFIILMCSVASWRQVRHWRDSVTVFERAISVTTGNWMAHYNAGKALLDAGDVDRALPHFIESVQIQPANPESQNNLGNALALKGRLAEAIDHFKVAVRLKVDYAKAHYNLGNALFHTGRHAEAVDAYREACRWNPEFSEAHYNLGYVLAGLGRIEEARIQFQETVRWNPDHWKARHHLNRLNQISPPAAPRS